MMEIVIVSIIGLMIVFTVIWCICDLSLMDDD